MGDDWFGHRDPLTGRPMGDRTEYTRWDWALANAVQTIEDFTDDKSGLPQWELDDERIEVYALKRVNKFQQAIDESTRGTAGKPYKPKPGEYFIPEIHSRQVDEDGNEVFPTFREWIDKNAAKDAD